MFGSPEVSTGAGKLAGREENDGGRSVNPNKRQHYGSTSQQKHNSHLSPQRVTRDMFAKPATQSATKMKYQQSVESNQTAMFGKVQQENSGMQQV